MERPGARRGAAAPAPRSALHVSWAESRRFVPGKFAQPLLEFMRAEAAGGLVMLLAAILALVWANSPWASNYFGVLDTRIEISFGTFQLAHLGSMTVRAWINDGLMVLFFFVVGLEIKRELVAGELRDPKVAALPAVAALGGMLLPALIYLLFSAGVPVASRGWGIPMATDIAFAIGVVALVGRRVPLGAKLFLLALAIVDDLGGILVIAIFYTEDFAFGWLAAALAGLGVVEIMKRTSIQPVTLYLAVGVFVWLAALESGVHPTVAGVALGLLTPVRSLHSPMFFPSRARTLVDRIDAYVGDGEVDHHTLDRVEAFMHDLRRLSRESVPPLDRLLYALGRWSSLVIVPLFAFANAGMRLSGETFVAAWGDRVVLGVFFGLVIGKSLGVTVAAWIAIRTGLGRMPRNTSWHHLFGLAILSGIGFTVAIFIASLAFSAPEAAAFADSAKLGIFSASIVAGLAGFLWLRATPDRPARRATRATRVV